MTDPASRPQADDANGSRASRDPAIEAAQRVLDKMFEEGQIARYLSNAFREVGEAAAREALKPVRTKWEEWESVLTDDDSVEAAVALSVLADFAPLIYTTEELTWPMT